MDTQVLKLSLWQQIMRLLSKIGETKLVKHLQNLASIGYGYTRAEVVSMATDYAIYLGKKQQKWERLKHALVL